jgi:hypothetical protein
MEGHDAVDVLRAQRLHHVLDALSNEGFSHGFLLLTPRAWVMDSNRYVPSLCQGTAAGHCRADREDLPLLYLRVE